jgi:hypothetical protein
MLKQVLGAVLLAATPVASANCQTIVLLPEAGSMSPPTIIVDPRAPKNAPVLVCGSIAHLSSGACVMQPSTVLRRH